MGTAPSTSPNPPSLCQRAQLPCAHPMGATLSPSDVLFGAAASGWDGSSSPSTLHPRDLLQGNRPISPASVIKPMEDTTDLGLLVPAWKTRASLMSPGTGLAAGAISPGGAWGCQRASTWLWPPAIADGAFQQRGQGHGGAPAPQEEAAVGAAPRGAPRGAGNMMQAPHPACSERPPWVAPGSGCIAWLRMCPGNR